MADRQDVVVRARVVLGEPADALGRRLPPPVDGLLVIAHAEDRYTPLGQQLEDAQVARVEVLVLVDDEGVVIHAHEVVVGLERLAQQVRQLAQQRVAHHAAVLAECPDETVAGGLVDVRVLLGHQ